MLLTNKTAVIYGAGGAIGGAVARAFAREGATVHLTGRRLAPVQDVADEINDAGGRASAAEVDALDENRIEEHLRGVAAEGRLDISFNAIGIPQDSIQGIPLVSIDADCFDLPMQTHPLSQFLTARSAARRMLERGSGVILTLTATPARLAAPFVGGMAPAWAAIEALTRVLAAELSPHGIRVVCLRSDAIPETKTIDTVFGLHANAVGTSPTEFRAMAEGVTLRRRLPTLEEVSNVATFLASDRASAMTGTVANLSGGSVVD